MREISAALREVGHIDLPHVVVGARTLSADDVVSLVCLAAERRNHLAVILAPLCTKNAVPKPRIFLGPVAGRKARNGVKKTVLERDVELSSRHDKRIRRDARACADEQCFHLRAPTLCSPAWHMSGTVTSRLNIWCSGSYSIRNDTTQKRWGANPSLTMPSWRSR